MRLLLPWRVSWSCPQGALDHTDSHAVDDSSSKRRLRHPTGNIAGAWSGQLPLCRFFLSAIALRAQARSFTRESGCGWGPADCPRSLRVWQCHLERARSMETESWEPSVGTTSIAAAPRTEVSPGRLLQSTRRTAAGGIPGRWDVPPIGRHNIHGTACLPCSALAPRRHFFAGFSALRERRKPRLPSAGRGQTRPTTFPVRLSRRSAARPRIPERPETTGHPDRRPFPTDRPSGCCRACRGRT